MICASVVSLIVAATCATAFAEERPTIQDVFYITGNHLYVLRFDLRIVDRSLESTWQESVQTYFNVFDVDSNGELTGDEQEKFPTTAELQRMLSLPALQNPPSKADFQPEDGRISFIELSAWLKLLGAGPFRVQGAAPSAAQQSTTAFDLFAELDVDADGALSKNEIAALNEDLKKRDADDDESLSPTELRPFAPAPRISPQLTTPSVPADTLLTVTSPAERRMLVNFLLERFDGKVGMPSTPPDRRLASNELVMFDKTFLRQDIDGNGHLDYEELSQFVRRPEPDISLMVDVAEAAETPVAVDGQSQAATLTVNSVGKAVLNFGDAEIELQIQSSVTESRKSYRKEFDTADADNNDYLDSAEISRSTQLRGLNRLIDADGDGKAFFEEFETFAASRSLLNRFRMELAADRRGANLFELIDSNKNGLLSFHELADASEELGQWDANADGLIEKAELPRNQQLTIGPGNAAASRSQSSGTQPGNQPQWFSRMDRNGDGEVTLREFVGPVSRFRRFDRDNNGILSPFEATLVE